MEPAAGTLDRKIRIEHPTADPSFTGAGSGSWGLIAEVWANVRDVLPSQSERLADGINQSERPARVRMRERDDVTSDMRLVLMRKRDVTQVERIMQIVSGPAVVETGGIEFMAKEYGAAGNGA